MNPPAQSTSGITVHAVKKLIQEFETRKLTRLNLWHFCLHPSQGVHLAPVGKKENINGLSPQGIPLRLLDRTGFQVQNLWWVGWGDLMSSLREELVKDGERQRTERQGA